MNDDLKMVYLNQMCGEICDKEKSELLLGALSTIHDIDWLENFYIKYAQSDDVDIARLSLTCISHLARMHNNMNTDKVIPFLKELNNSNQEFMGVIQDVLEDIEIFCKEP